MKIAFSSEENKGIDGMLAHHFGRCPYYVFVDVEDNKIKSIETKENPFFNDHEPGVVPQFIADKKADVIVSGGMGPRAIEWFKDLKVKAITAQPKKIKEILDDYFEGKLKGAEPCNEHK